MAILIIDGNNLSGALRKAGLSDGDDKTLAALVQGWRHARQRRRGKAPDVWLFLDAGAAGRTPGGLGGLSVRVAPRGVTADDAIVDELSRIADRARCGEVVVVTSDRDLAERTGKMGAMVRTCPEFIVELRALAVDESQALPFTQQERRKIEMEFGVSPSIPKAPTSRRIRCVRDVANLTDARALLSVVTDGPAWARRRAVRALTRLSKPEAARGLQGLLAHAVPGVRAEAVTALASFQSPEAAHWLEPLASDPYPIVRVAVARALCVVGGAQAEEMLTVLRCDPRRRVRLAAG